MNQSINKNEEVVLDKDTIIASQTDKSGCIIYANDDFCKISGYTKDELIGRPHNINRHPDMPSQAFYDLWKTIQDGRVWNGIVKNLAKDGSYYWVNATIYPSTTPDGDTRYISVRVKPTTQEIEDAQTLYKTLN
jgi:aerotaxis receptor